MRTEETKLALCLGKRLGGTIEGEECDSRLWRPLQDRQGSPFPSLLALFPKPFPAASLHMHTGLFLIEKVDRSHRNLKRHIISSLANRSEAHPAWVE